MRRGSKKWLSYIQSNPEEKVLFFVLIISAAHFFTLLIPGIRYDEAIWADRVFNGHLSTWGQILPPDHQIFQNICAFGAYPVFIKILEFFVHVGGLHIWFLRIPSLLMGLLGLLTLIILIRQLKLPAISYWSIPLFSSSWLFFNSVHNVSQIPYILLIGLINWIWLFSRKEKISGFICGLLASLALAIHLLILIFFISFPFIFYWVRKEKKTHWKVYIYWLLGILLGLFSSALFIDIENIILFFEVNNGWVIRSPLIIDYFMNPIEVVNKVLKIWLTETYYFQNPFHVVAVWLLLTSYLWQLRRFRLIQRPERTLNYLSSVMLISYGLIAGTDKFGYFFLLYPLFLMQLFIVIGKLVREKIKLDMFDILISSALIFFLLIISPYRVADGLPRLLVIPLIIRFMHGSISSIRKPLLKYLIYLGVMIAGIIFSVEYHYFIFYYFKTRPILSIASIIFPWIFLRFENGNIEIRPVFSVIVKNSAFLRRRVLISGLFISVLIFNLFFDQKLLIGSITVKTHDNKAFNSVLHEHRNKKIAAPMNLWLYQPALNIQCVRALIFAKSQKRRLSYTKSLKIYNPDLILWPGNSLINLEIEKGKENVEIERIWEESPVGPLMEVKLKS